jgi:fatty-acyl-CoA synthase
MATSIASALEWWARTKGDREALVFAEESLSYRELRNWSGRIARHLAANGVSPGDRVAVLGGNTPEWAAAAFGVIKAGAVLIPLNPRLVAAELHTLVESSGSSVVIADSAFTGRLAEVAERGSKFDVLDLAALREHQAGPDETFRVERDPDETLAVMFTSGSTGLSKGVILTNRTLLNISFEATLTEDGLRPGGRTLLLLPFCFTPGLVWGLYMHAVLGSTLVVEAELDPSRAVRRLAEHRIQAIFGVPLIYEVMAKAPEFADADLSSLITATVGGAAVPVPLLKKWADKGVTLRQIYGMVEGGGTVTATLTHEAAEHPDSCGIGSVFTEIKVVRDDGSECDPGETGQILLRGPSVTPGYWGDPETTANAIQDGWLRSGDLGKRDADGRLTFVDRLKDLIISGGINISPVELEAVIARVPGVEEVAVIAAPDEKFGETPAAIVYSAAAELDPAALTSEIVAECDRQVAGYKVPRYVVVREEPLPRLPNGKISKRDIRDEYADLTGRYPKVR